MYGELEKLKIIAFRSDKCAPSELVGSFVVLFNPASYALKYAVTYSSAQAPGNSATSQRFGVVEPQDYSFELIFDGTGTAAAPLDVAASIDEFLRLCGKLNGEIHRPNVLMLSWGALALSCVLKSAEIAYSLFDAGGRPLRAKVVAVFAESVEDTLRVAQENKQSPDVTHIHTLVAGETLPQLAQRVYGDASYAVRIARHNGLAHLRDLKPGRTLELPPVSALPAH